MIKYIIENWPDTTHGYYASCFIMHVDPNMSGRDKERCCRIEKEKERWLIILKMK